MAKIKTDPLTAADMQEFATLTVLREAETLAMTGMRDISDHSYLYSSALTVTTVETGTAVWIGV